MSTQEHTISIAFDGKEYKAKLDPSLPGISASFNSQESFPVFSAVMNWLKVLEPDRNRGAEDDERFIILRIHKSAWTGRGTGWGFLAGATRWPSRTLIVDEPGGEEHYFPHAGGLPVIVKLLKQLGGSATLAELTQAKTEDGDTIWNHLGGGQYPEDLLGPLSQMGVIAYSEEGTVTLLDTKGNPVQR